MECDAVILHSGGLDSSVCLLRAIEQGRQVLSLGINYGQRARIEFEYAAKLCGKWRVPRKVIQVAWDKPERIIPLDRPVEEMRRQVSPAFLPGRNVVFLTLACAEAAGIGAAEVWIGINAVDFSGYPDCTPEFAEAFRAMINVAVPGGPEIVAPLIQMSKPEIASEARRLGLEPGDTWSCYRPQFSARGISPCGKCDACVLHSHAWEHANNRETSK